MVGLGDCLATDRRKWAGGGSVHERLGSQRDQVVEHQAVLVEGTGKAEDRLALLGDGSRQLTADLDCAVLSPPRPDLLDQKSLSAA
jgi:hypothetical protein